MASMGGVDTATAIVLALISALVLAALHLLAPRIRKLPSVPEHATASFAGGLAASYVFLHLLPELAHGNTELRELFGEGSDVSPLTELAIFAVALVGFCLFYGLERLAERSKHPSDSDRATEAAALGPTSTSAPGAESASPPTSARAGNAEPSGRAGGGGYGRVFWVHLGSFAVYNAIITYTLSSTYRTGVAYAVLFTMAMGLHFVLSDRGLEEHYGPQFDRKLPRLLLAGALLLGWALAALFAPTRSLTVSVLTAFLAGSVLLNVFKEEIPTARRSSFPWFITGLLGYAALLATVTALSE